MGLVKEKELAKPPKLKRALGLFEITAYGVGIILGAGIYALIGEAAGIAGNALWLSFLIGAVIASLTGLSYCELGTMFPKEAAEYVYTKKAFKNKLFPFLVGWIIIVTGMVVAATVALGFGGYLYAITGIAPTIGAIILLIACSLLNFWGIKESARFNILFTGIEMLGLILIIIFGISFFGSVNYFEMPNNLAGVLSGAALIFFAYVGFEDIVNMAEETRKPKKVIPKAIIIAVIITTVLYMLVSISAVSILDWQILGASAAPLADVSGAAIPGSSWWFSIIALFATANTVLIAMIVESRMIWGMARDKSLPKILSKIHSVRRTPWVSVATVGIVAMILVTLFDIRTIAEVTNFSVFIVFISVNASLIYLRYRRPDAKRPFKLPLNIGKFPILPLIAIAISLSMFYFLTLEPLIIGASILVLGVIVYEILKRKKLIKP